MRRIAPIVVRVAHLNGEDRPTDAQVVLTSRRAAVRLTGDDVCCDTPVYFVQMHGHFLCTARSTPGGDIPQPTGTVIRLTLEATSLRGLDFNISNVSLDLEPLGRVERVSLHARR